MGADCCTTFGHFHEFWSLGVGLPLQHRLCRFLGLHLNPLKELGAQGPLKGLYCTCALQRSGSRDLRQGKVSESLGHGIPSSEQLDFYLVPSLDLIIGGCSHLK